MIYRNKKTWRDSLCRKITMAFWRSSKAGRTRSARRDSSICLSSRGRNSVLLALIVDAPTTEKQKLNIVRDAKNEASAQSILDALEGKVNGAKRSKESSGGSFASNALKDRYAQLKEALEQPKSTELVSSKLKLPAINKSSSHTTHLHKNANDLTAEQYGVASHRVRSLPRQP